MLKLTFWKAQNIDFINLSKFLFLILEKSVLTFKR